VIDQVDDHSPSVLPTIEYVYTSIGEDQIRLISLHKGAFDAPIHISINQVSLQMPGYDYYALSYAWGDDHATETLFIDENLADSMPTFPLLSNFESNHVFRIRPNLYAALKHFRSETEDLWWWIDALCINQTDSSEKSSQLPKMLDIYSHAFSVCIWLGEPDLLSINQSPAQDPLDFIHFIVNLKLLDGWINNESPDETITASFVAFAKLLRRPWFRRRWVIQEVSACRQASVHCGHKRINWIDFVDAVQLFMAKIERIKTIFNKSWLFLEHRDAFSHVESSGAIALVNAASHLVRKTAQGEVITRLWDIESLVMTFVHYETSDPRDVIYALLPLAHDRPSAPETQPKPSTRLIPNYSICSHRLYTQFVSHSITTRGSLDIICRHWAPHLWEGRCERSLDPRNLGPQNRRTISPASLPPLSCLFGQTYFEVPSWVGSVEHSAFGPPSIFKGRLNGDGFVGEIGSERYKASWGTAPQFCIASENVAGIWRPILMARGIVLGKIGQVSSRVVDGIIPEECLRMAGWNSRMDFNEIPDSLWRTLVADRTSNGKKAPSWWRRACMHCLTKTNYHGDLSTSTIVASQSLPQIVVTEYLQRVQAVVWNRKFFLCRDAQNNSERLLGLGPRSIAPDDLVCILFGCSVPVILRKVEDIRDRFSLVGECFVYERMDGEALASLDAASLDSATVEFNVV